MISMVIFHKFQGCYQSSLFLSAISPATSSQEVRSVFLVIPLRDTSEGNVAVGI
jgi:hypothetical protein